MDHAHHMMDHGDMDHGHGGGGGGGGSMEDMCSMSMLFTWDTTNLCIVFRQWHVRSTTSLVISLIAVVLLAMGYEGLRALSRKYELAVAKHVDSLPSSTSTPAGGNIVTETTPFFATGQNQAQAGKRAHILKGALYALQNFYAFMLMLVFMTYNGWVMIAVSLGAFLGYITFGQNTSSTKDNACH